MGIRDVPAMKPTLTDSLSDSEDSFPTDFALTRSPGQWHPRHDLGDLLNITTVRENF